VHPFFCFRDQIIILGTVRTGAHAVVTSPAASLAQLFFVALLWLFFKQPTDVLQTTAHIQVSVHAMCKAVSSFLRMKNPGH